MPFTRARSVNSRGCDDTPTHRPTGHHTAHQHHTSCAKCRRRRSRSRRSRRNRRRRRRIGRASAAAAIRCTATTMSTRRRRRHRPPKMLKSPGTTGPYRMHRLCRRIGKRSANRVEQEMCFFLWPKRWLGPRTVLHFIFFFKCPVSSIWI